MQDIAQEIEREDESVEFRVRFKGFKKLSDARWFTEEYVRKNLKGLLDDWERRKNRYGVDIKKRKDGLVTTIKKK